MLPQAPPSICRTAYGHDHIHHAYAYEQRHVCSGTHTRKSHVHAHADRRCAHALDIRMYVPMHFCGEVSTQSATVGRRIPHHPSIMTNRRPHHPHPHCAPNVSAHAGRPAAMAGRSACGMSVGSPKMGWIQPKDFPPCGTARRRQRALTR